MSMYSKALKKVERKVSSVIPHQHSADRRAVMQETKAAMDLYNEQKDTLHKANEDLAKQKETEQKKLHEKQIRSLRSSYRGRSGFLGTEDNEVKETLG